jgi:crossover junction endodeoxyribonuclease RusA
MGRSVIRLALPYPLSANRYWQSFVPKGATRAIVHLSTEAKAYKKAVAWACVAAGIRKPLLGRLVLTLQLYPHRPFDYLTRQRKLGDAWDDTVQCIDLGNADKVLSDALNGIVYGDDKQVWRIVKDRMEPDGQARVIVTVDHLPPRTRVVQHELALPVPAEVF